MIREKRLFVSVISLLVILAIASIAVATYSAGSIGDHHEPDDEFSTSELAAALALDSGVNGIAQEIFAYVISGDIGERDEALATIRELKASDDTFHNSPADETSRLSELEQHIVTGFADFDESTNNVIAMFEESGALDRPTFDAHEATTDSLTADIADLIALRSQAVNEAQEDARFTEQRARDAVIRQGYLIAALSSIIAVATYFLFRHTTAARQAAEHELLLRTHALDATTVAVLITSKSGADQAIIYANPAFERVTGYALGDILGRSPSFLIGPRTDAAKLAMIDRAVEQDEPVSVLIENYNASGTPFWNDLDLSMITDESGTVTHVVGLTNDVTERVRLEGRTMQAGKMNAVGQLAGGIAHDFNNYLTVIEAALAVIQTDPDADTDYWLNQIAEAGKRSAALTKQLLTFAGAPMETLEILDLDDVVRNLEPLLQSTIDEHISIDVVTDGNGATVSANRSQLEQVITNLVLNARDALPTGGSITIETCNKMLTDDNVSGDTHAHAGPYVMLAVADDGVGVDPAIAADIFEPFVTTKDAGLGGGLGLATVYGIVNQAGGTISVHSEPGQTTFEVYLPRSSESVVEVPEVPEEALDVESAGRVLLVEDHEIVRAALRATLTSLGYDVAEAENGVVALEYLHAHSTTQIVVSDVTMPEMGGVELAARARELNPALKVLLMSGYTQADPSQGDSSDSVLTKPFSREELSAAMASLGAVDA